MFTPRRSIRASVGACLLGLFLATALGAQRESSETPADRVFRGGGYTKDAVYLRGLIQLLAYLAAGKELLPLYIGKISAEHLPFIDELRWRQVLQPPSLTPGFLASPQAQQRLAALHRGMTVTELAGVLD